MKAAALALALVLAACGPEEVPGVETTTAPPPTVAIGLTPNGVDVFPGGWYVHAYPGLCVFLIRNQDGGIEACYIDPDPNCKPADTRGCRAFPR